MRLSSFRIALLLVLLAACTSLAGKEESEGKKDEDVANVDVDDVAAGKQADGPPVEKGSEEDKKDEKPVAALRETPTSGSEEVAAASNKRLKVHEVDVSFYHGFFASLSVIIVSELGDKTWFIAVIMSMKHSRLTVFSGAITALALMTILSACLGWVTQLIPRTVTYYVSTALFALFGLKMLHEGWHMSSNETQEGFDEAAEEVQKKELEREGPKYSELESGVKTDKSGASPEHLRMYDTMHAPRTTSNPWVIFAFVSTIFLEAFTLTFLAEWGDRSQLTTIILGAREDIAGVIIGGILGHALCTGIAVLGGKLVAQRISVRNVTLIGGVVFILFALSAFFISQPEPDSIVMEV